MKKAASLALILLSSILLSAQEVTRAEFEKLKEKVNYMASENERLRREMDNIKSAVGQLRQTNSIQNSNIDKSKSALVLLREKIDSSVESKIFNLKQFIDSASTQTDEDMKNTLKKLNNLLPVGSIVAYHLDVTKIPSNWAICDGKQVNDPSSIYNGYKVPNLAGYFVRGKTSTESVGDTGGSDTEPSHTHSIPSHKHEVGDHTHQFTTNTSMITGNRHCIDPNYGLQCFAGNPNTQYFLAAPTKSEYESQTSHSHTGTTGNASTGYTQNGGGGTTGASGAESNIPRYRAFNYIIKIK